MPKTDGEMTQFINDLLNVIDDYINFDYLVVQDKDNYEEMKSKMADYFRNQGI